MNPQQGGFSLLELLICIGIASILISISLPSMIALTGKQSINSQVHEIRSALQLTRSLAVTNSNVWTLCTLNAEFECVKLGGLTLAVFRDDNKNRKVDSDERLRLNTPIKNLSVKLSASNRSYMRFKMTGSSKESGNFQVCALNSELDYGRQVIVYRSGRIRISQDNDGDGYDESASGAIHCATN
jgi:prepilin-type N-terminal cleavage/methylation domain-containing protein